MSRATTYRHLKAGKLRAIKNNSRTLIDVDHGLNFLASQPEYAPDHPARGVGRSPVAPEMVH